MKRITTTLSFAVFLMFGVYAYTQEPSDNDKARQQEEQKPEPKPEQTRPPAQEEPKPSKQAKPKREQPSKQESAKRAHEEHDQNAGQEERDQKTGQAEERDQKTGQARQGHAAGKGGHIPDDKFRASFGRQHTIVINQPVIVEGRPRFQSGSYWFEIVDAWPADWAYSDDCYIDYVDGDYFLFDLLHPGERIAVFVVL